MTVCVFPALTCGLPTALRADSSACMSAGVSGSGDTERSRVVGERLPLILRDPRPEG